MKKICFVTTVHETLRMFVMEVAEYLRKENIEIYFICNNDEKFQQELPNYIHLIPINMKRGIDILGVKSVWQMYLIFKREKFDLVQYATPNAALYASIASFFARTKNRLYAQWGIYYVALEGDKRKLFKLIEKIICKLSTHIQPISILNREFAISGKLYSKDKSSVIGIGSVKGIDFTRFDINKKANYREQIRNKYNISEGDVVFGFVGRITRDKGINETLFAFKQFINKNRNAWLLICGEEDINANLNAEVYEWSKKNSRVIFCGKVNEVEKYFSAMDIFLFPTYREGFGEVAIEAQAMGVPVITTNVPGPADSVQKDISGLIVPSKDEESLYNAMEFLYNNQEKIISMGQAGRKWVREKFNAAHLIEMISKFKINMINKEKG